jgi:hypothetical protein
MAVLVRRAREYVGKKLVGHVHFVVLSPEFLLVLRVFLFFIKLSSIIIEIPTMPMCLK